MPRPGPCNCCGGIVYDLEWCCGFSEDDVLEMTFLVDHYFTGSHYAYSIGETISLLYGSFDVLSSAIGATCDDVIPRTGFIETPPQDTPGPFFSNYRTRLWLEGDEDTHACTFWRALYDSDPGDLCYVTGQTTTYTLAVISCDPLLIDVYNESEHPGTKIASITRA